MQVKTMTMLLLLSLAACGEAPAPEPAATAAAANGGEMTTDGSIYADAVANAARTEADRERDAGRKPAEVLEFFGIEPGMTVLDMFSGGGYYTELLSYVVGPTGKVVAHTNSAYAGFVGDETANRYANDRLPNVEHLLAENNELELPADEFDAILLVLSYHDIYFSDPNSWPKIDGPGLLEELKKGLKPGGTLDIVDHYAAAGSPRETGGTLHRIDPQIVIDELEAAGFVLEARSDVLRNLQDDREKGVFDPEIRGKTDRFVMRFRLPR
jgi:predicted methyltransferase